MFNNYNELINNQTGNITTTKDESESESEGDVFGLAIVFFIFLFFGMVRCYLDKEYNDEEAVQRAKNRIYEKNASRKGVTIV